MWLAASGGFQFEVVMVRVHGVFSTFLMYNVFELVSPGYRFPQSMAVHFWVHSESQ